MGRFEVPKSDALGRRQAARQTVPADRRPGLLDTAQQAAYERAVLTEVEDDDASMAVRIEERALVDSFFDILNLYDATDARAFHAGEGKDIVALTVERTAEAFVKGEQDRDIRVVATEHTLEALLARPDVQERVNQRLEERFTSWMEAAIEMDVINIQPEKIDIDDIDQDFASQKKAVLEVLADSGIPQQWLDRRLEKTLQKWRDEHTHKDRLWDLTMKELWAVGGNERDVDAITTILNKSKMSEVFEGLRAMQPHLRDISGEGNKLERTFTLFLVEFIKERLLGLRQKEEELGRMLEQVRHEKATVVSMYSAAITKDARQEVDATLAQATKNIRRLDSELGIAKHISASLGNFDEFVDDMERTLQQFTAPKQAQGFITDVIETYCVHLEEHPARGSHYSSLPSLGRLNERLTLETLRAHRATRVKSRQSYLDSKRVSSAYLRALYFGK